MTTADDFDPWSDDALPADNGLGALAVRSRAELGERGALARAHEGFAPREAQQNLAAAVADAIMRRRALLAEAGTGTGKTYAYLVPALLSGRRVIISTGTRALQDQLFHRDLPRVRQALGVGLRAALLKGRANYLCHYRLERAQGERVHDRPRQVELAALKAWSGETRSGDIGEFDGISEDSPLWPQVTSTAENCLGNECPFWRDCFVVKARQAAQAADVVVVNHHLLFADQAIRKEGFGEILPGAECFIIDEAHQLPELASQFFGESLSARQLRDLARDALTECANTVGALHHIQAPSENLKQSVIRLREAMRGLRERGALHEALAAPVVTEALNDLALRLRELMQSLEPLRDSAPGFDSCHARALMMLNRLLRLRGESCVHDVDAFVDEEDSGSREAFAVTPTSAGVQNSDHGCDDNAAERASHHAEQILWYELRGQGFSLNSTPLHVADILDQQRERSGASWIFTSATLAVGGHFDHFAGQIGLVDPETLIEASPFDYATQTLAYLPPNMPDPRSFEFGEAWLNAVLPVIEASKGRAFLLFTAGRALQRARDALVDRIDYPLFVQGDAPRGVLLERFRESGNGVLLGLASFWQGVDVPGDALSLVVIDKLPFAAPDDPVLEARLDAIRRSGGNPFRDWQLPSAVISLKQGAGRLIRTVNDRGVLMLCDPRLTSGYGRVFMKSLPPFPITRNEVDVLAFFTIQ